MLGRTRLRRPEVVIRSTLAFRIFEMELEAHVAVERYRSVEIDEHIDVAVRPSFVARDRAEERETPHPEPLAHAGGFCSQDFEDLVARHAPECSNALQLKREG